MIFGIINIFRLQIRTFRSRFNDRNIFFHIPSTFKSKDLERWARSNNFKTALSIGIDYKFELGVLDFLIKMASAPSRRSLGRKIGKNRHDRIIFKRLRPPKLKIVYKFDIDACDLTIKMSFAMLRQRLDRESLKDGHDREIFKRILPPKIKIVCKFELSVPDLTIKMIKLPIIRYQNKRSDLFLDPIFRHKLDKKKFGLVNRPRHTRFDQKTCLDFVIRNRHQKILLC